MNAILQKVGMIVQQDEDPPGQDWIGGNGT